MKGTPHGRCLILNCLTPFSVVPCEHPAVGFRGNSESTEEHGYLFREDQAMETVESF